MKTEQDNIFQIGYVIIDNIQRRYPDLNCDDVTPAAEFIKTDQPKMFATLEDAVKSQRDSVEFAKYGLSYAVAECSFYPPMENAKNRRLYSVNSLTVYSRQHQQLALDKTVSSSQANSADLNTSNPKQHAKNCCVM